MGKVCSIAFRAGTFDTGLENEETMQFALDGGRVRDSRTLIILEQRTEVVQTRWQSFAPVSFKVGVRLGTG